MKQKRQMRSMDGNSAAAHIAYAFSEVVAVYPITPSTTMAERIEEWSNQGRKNLFGQRVEVIEMQSEAGAAGAVHGILSGGAFSSTFTASQGLLLMIPNMYKIAGEIMPTVFHVSARALAGQALSIFGDHQDVMATRATGFCMLCSNSVQEAMDLSLVAHLASLRASLPFLHFFDGFRTSHEMQKIEVIDEEAIRPLVDWEAVENHRKRALNPEHPHLRGSAQNPDIYFQLMEAANRFYLAVPLIVKEEMEKVYQLTGRRYHLFDYVGHPEAERVVVIMGSGAEAAEEVVNYLIERGEKVGVLKVRLYRPFSAEHFMKALPKSVKKIAVLDRTKEQGSFGEPLYLDVCSILQESKFPALVVGGRYGLGSKDFTPRMIAAIFHNLSLPVPKNHFTVGIIDDVTNYSLPVGEPLDVEPKGVVRCKFWGLGGDGTVGANKDAIKIIGDYTDKYVQGYFAYDSKKTSGLTISHLRFGDKPIQSTYLIQKADYIACHHPSYVKKYDLLEGIKEGGTFVLNAPWSLEELEEQLPSSMKRTIASNHLNFFVIEGDSIAREVGLGGRVNMIMQSVFFRLSDVLEVEKALKLLKEAIQKTYGKKGGRIVEMNQRAVDLAGERLVRISYPEDWAQAPDETLVEKTDRPPFIRKVVDEIQRQKGDLLPVSAFLPGGFFPLSTTAYEKRGIALQIPHWRPELCIQCNQCAFVCPHSAIRPFLLSEEEAKRAPAGYSGVKPMGLKGAEGLLYSMEVSPLDCTGCESCVKVCPSPKGKALEMRPAHEVQEKGNQRWNFLSSLPSRSGFFGKFTVKGSQLRPPLLEFSGACAGCGETPYVKLLTQLFGDRMIIANATGCSSIWGGSAPSIPWTVNKEGHGPAWANSLFEDNAEYGFGIGLAVHHQREALAERVKDLLGRPLELELKLLLKEWLAHKEEGEKSKELAQKIKSFFNSSSSLLELKQREDLLAKPSLWIIGGDGWAYDIGYGGLDHVLSLGRDVNILVLDTEVYSNTGGQASKATPLGAIAKFASSGKKTAKKDLGLMAMAYGSIYVASVSLGANPMQLIQALKEAESYEGPSLILAYTSCISHGIAAGMAHGIDEEKRAVASGYWLNYRFDPRLKLQGKNPLQLDSPKPTLSVKEFLEGEMRFQYLQRTNPEEAQRFCEQLDSQLKERFLRYQASAVQA